MKSLMPRLKNWFTMDDTFPVLVDNYFPVFTDSFNDSNQWKRNDDGSYTLEVKLPGIDKKYLNVYIEDSILKIEAKTGEHSYTVEQIIGKFHDEPTATLLNGILYLDFPAPPKKEKIVKKITIK